MHADAHCFAHAVTPLHETNNSLDVWTTTTTREVLANNAIIRARAQKLFCRLSFRSQINFSFFFLSFFFLSKKKNTETQTLNMAAGTPKVFFSYFSPGTKKRPSLLIPSRFATTTTPEKKKKKKKKSGVR